MATQPFKGITPVYVGKKYADWIMMEYDDNVLDVYWRDWITQEPASTRWGTVGFVPFKVFKGTEGTTRSIVHPGKPRLPCVVVRLSERVLPGSVIRKHMQPLIDELERKKGDPADRKEKAEIREKIIEELLPKAFVRNTDIPVVFACDRGEESMILIGTGSPRKADEIASLILYSLADDAPRMIGSRVRTTDLDPAKWMRELAQENHIGEDIEYFEAGRVLALKGKDKKSIRFINTHLSDDEVQQAIADNYVREMEIEYHHTAVDSESGVLPYTDPVVVFQLSDELVFKRFELVTFPWRTKGRETDELALALGNYATKVADAFSMVLDSLVNMLGGWKIIEDYDENDPLGTGDSQTVDSSTSADQANFDDLEGPQDDGDDDL